MVQWETFILIWICCTWTINQAALLVDLIESICGHQHTAQGDETDGEDEDEDEDETFLEYHSPDEDNISKEDSDDD